jgi:hypothetical protein
MADPNFPEVARKPRPIASSPFWMGTSDAPGLSAAPSSTPGMAAPLTLGMQIPTPMGWLTPDQAPRMLNHLAPNREAIADTLGVPMDGVAWAARTLGAKGISGGYGEPDPLTQIFNKVLYPGMPQQQIWKPGPDVPLSSANIRSLLDQYIPPGGLF